MLKKSSNHLSPFYEELFHLLHQNSEQQIIDKGLNAEEASLFKELSAHSLDTLPLPEFIEKYQQLFVETSSTHLEKMVMEAFSAKDYMELGLSRTYPRVFRGLPRAYLRDQPSCSKIKANFDHLPSLKRQAVSKALFSLYSKIEARGKVVLFTWVMKDGHGDFMAGIEVVRLLRARLPKVEIEFVALVPENFKANLSSTTLIPYLDECPLDLIPQEVLDRMRNADLILQLPTFYPFTRELTEKLKEISSSKPMPKFESVGEYGFVDSSWFHPKSGAYSFGLHFLEKGILTRKPCVACWEDVQNEKLKGWREEKNRFYLAYLATPIGGAIYLHALLKSLEEDPCDIDLCVPEIGWLLAFYEKQKAAGRPILEWEMGVSSIDIYFEEKFCSLPISPKGKKVRILCPGALSQSDFRALLALSGEWVAVRGNQSFSEAISQGKVFFYDGRGHSRSFVKDFAAVSENRIRSFPGALECVRGMVQAFLYNLPVQQDVWVDETYFQELEDWTAIALKIALALQDPETATGFRQLGKIISEEFSANSFLCHLVQRALFHRLHPYLESLEEENICKFTRNEIKFRSFILTVSSLIETCQKTSSGESHGSVSENG